MTSRVARTGALGAALLTLLSCSSDSPPAPPDDGFDRNAMLRSLGEHVVLRTYREFHENAQALETAASAWATAQAAGGGAGAGPAEAAREAWRAAMRTWQRAELYQLGPAGVASEFMGGEGIRDTVYSWPTVNACAVDQQLVANRFEEPGFFDTALVNVYGLAALEYLLFHGGTTNACPPQSAINDSGSWAALSADELALRRARYTKAAAGHLVHRAAALRSAWEPVEGNFLGKLASGGEEGSPYASAQEAVEQLFASLFYLDLRVKDAKLAVPAGISPDCFDDTCPDQLESRWADVSASNIRQNLVAFRDAFTGGPVGEEDRPGFDDLLAARDGQALAEQMLADVEAALAAVDAVGPSLRTALAQDLAKVEALHAAVKQVTDDLKSEFATVLDLRVPQSGAADND